MSICKHGNVVDYVAHWCGLCEDMKKRKTLAAAIDDFDREHPEHRKKFDEAKAKILDDLRKKQDPPPSDWQARAVEAEAKVERLGHQHGEFIDARARAIAALTNHETDRAIRILRGEE